MGVVVRGALLHRVGVRAAVGRCRRCVCALERSRPPRSGGLWFGLLVLKRTQNARLPAGLIGGEVDLSTKNDRI